MTIPAWATLGARLLLGGVFLAAGLLKLSDPSAFASAIAAFQIVPPPLIPRLALSLPYFEIILGGILLLGLQQRTAAFTAMILLAAYTAALASALARGLPLECDCFGSSTSAPLALLRDAALLGIALTLYIVEIRRAKT